MIIISVVWLLACLLVSPPVITFTAGLVIALGADWWNNRPYYEVVEDGEEEE
jgi:hypothetical protein